MSNPMAIAAVTATLRNLLAAAVTTEADLNDAIVTAQPLDKARDATATTNQLNLFLYLISPNAAWRNQDMPGRVRSGEVASPPLSLNLFYLLSTYGRDNDVEKPFSHLLLGQGMSILYDHPLLGHDEIAAALQDNDLGDQIERVRITLQPLSIEDISKLWAGFQMQYRLSVAYEVAVVLIDTRRPIRAAPPVLARGPGGGGFVSTPDSLAAYPCLTSLMPGRPMRIGETVRAVGVGLIGDTVTAQFLPLQSDHPADHPVVPVDVPAVVDPTGGFSVVVPPALSAGRYMFSLLFSTAGTEPRRTNELPLWLAPQITSPMPMNVRLGGGNPRVSLTVEPVVLPNQKVELILRDRPIEATTRAAGRLGFTLAGVALGRYPVRLRVGSVDSLPVIDPDASVLAIDPAQTIVVVP